MQKNKIEIPLLPHQEEFLFSESPSTGLVAGFGSGKSFIASIKSSKKLIQLRCNVGYYLPTYQLIKDIAFENIHNILETFKVPFKLNESDKTFRTPYGNIYCRSMDNPTNIVGYQTGYALIDEADILPKEKMQKAYKAIVARNRQILPEGVLNCTDMVSTPEGFKFLYEYYVKQSNERRALIKGRTLDNPFLPDSYIQNLYDTYPKEQLEAYMNGEFVNLTSGTVYRFFNRKENVNNTVKLNENHVLYIGMDFNITNMAATVSIKENGIRYVIDEFVDKYDTSEMINSIKAKYPNNRVIIYPDAAGGARNTSGKSDHRLLRDAGFKIIAPKKNPLVRDRINKVNKQFEDKKTFINSDNCPSLIEALEKQSYNKTGVPDKSGGFDHIVDAFGYEVYNSEKAKIKKRVSSVF